MKLMQSLLVEKVEELHLEKMTGAVDIDVLLHTIGERNMSVKYFGSGLMHVMLDIIRDLESRYEKELKHKKKVHELGPQQVLFLEAAYYPGNQSIYATLECRALVRWTDAGSTTEQKTFGFVNHGQTFKPIGYEEAYGKIHDDDSLDLRELLTRWMPNADRVNDIFKKKL